MSRRRALALLTLTQHRKGLEHPITLARKG